MLHAARLYQCSGLMDSRSQALQLLALGGSFLSRKSWIRGNKSFWHFDCLWLKTSGWSLWLSYITLATLFTPATSIWEVPDLKKLVHAHKKKNLPSFTLLTHTLTKPYDFLFCAMTVNKGMLSNLKNHIDASPYPYDSVLGSSQVQVAWQKLDWF